MYMYGRRSFSKSGVLSYEWMDYMKQLVKWTCWLEYGNGYLLSFTVENQQEMSIFSVSGQLSALLTTLEHMITAKMLMIEMIRLINAYAIKQPLYTKNNTPVGIDQIKMGKKPLHISIL